MTRPRGFKTTGRFGTHKLGTRTRTEKGRLDNSLFRALGDKGCSSRRVATLSSGAASTTGVSVESLNPTMTTPTTVPRQHNLSDTPTTMSFVDSTKLCRFYKGRLQGGVSQ